MSPPPQRPSVLIAAADAAEAAAWCAALAAAGCEVACVASAEDAVAELERRTVDLLVLDAAPREEAAAALCPRLGAGKCAALVALEPRDPCAWARVARLDGCEALARPFAPLELALRLPFALRAARLRRELARERAELALCQRVARIGSWRLEAEGGALRCSPEARRVLGLGPAQELLTLEQLLALAPDEQREGLREWLAAAAEGKAAGAVEHVLRGPDGRARVVRLQAQAPGAEPPDGGAGGVVQDVTERRRADAPAASPHDLESPTGLPGRARFLGHVQQVLARAHPDGRRAAALCVDLEHARAWTGLLARGSRETLLLAVARRLREWLRSDDALAHLDGAGGPAIARLQGDAFMVLILERAPTRDAARVAARILELLAEPFSVEGRELALPASVGIAAADGCDAEEMLRRAETAAYCARQQGAGAVLAYSAEMNTRAFERMALESGLRRALEREELEIHYQPRVAIKSGAIVGAEALVRWRHPELGLVSPGRFIPLAEQSGLIVPIGAWILRQACEQNRAWQDAGLPPLRMAVNLSTVQFRQPDLHDVVTDCLRATGLESRWIELELTESLLMQQPDSAARALERLAAAGIHLSIDDFGTGYSSLAYLKRFPIDALKIDQSFIRELTSDPDDAAIATSIILMGRSLKLTVVAEGVETRSQLAFLRAMQCDEAQGYLFSPPVPAARFAELLRTSVARPFAA